MILTFNKVIVVEELGNVNNNINKQLKPIQYEYLIRLTSE